jgi:hypothetical protein
MNPVLSGAQSASKVQSPSPGKQIPQPHGAPGVTHVANPVQSIDSWQHISRTPHSRITGHSTRGAAGARQATNAALSAHVHSPQ